MSVNLSPLAGAGWQFFSDDGVPLAGGLLYSYTAGTTTPEDTFSDNTGGTPNTNPIVLDAAGRVSGEVWLVQGTLYKFTLATAEDVEIATWDNVTGINDIDTTVFQDQLDLQLPAYFSAPPPIGDGTPNTGTFTTLTGTTVNATTLSVSSTVSGAGFTSLFASPPAIGGTAPAGGTFTFINTPFVTLTYGATVNVDCALSDAFYMVFGAGNVSALNFTNMKDGQTIRLYLKQDATGGRTVTWGSASPSITWTNGATGTLSVTANTVDLVTLTYNSALSAWLGSVSENLQTGTQSLGNNGYIKFPGGLILQWGRYVPGTNVPVGTYTVTFPLAFPTAVFHAMATSVIPSTGNVGDLYAQIFDTANLSTTGMKVRLNLEGGGEDKSQGFFWQALGN